MMYTPETALPGLSRTALGICAYCAMINRNPRYRTAFYDPFAERLFAGAAENGQAVLDRLTDWPSVLAFADAQGIARRLVVHVLWRKTFMMGRTLRALAGGAEQVVVLGAGLDTLGLRLSTAHPRVPVFEVDRPGGIAAKRALVARNFGTPPNLRYTAVDFAREATLDRLRETGYDPARPAVFIAEVSLEYVPPAEVARVYAMVRANGCPETRFLTSFTDTAGFSAARGEADGIGAAVAGAGEPFLFSVPPAGVADYAASQGFALGDHLHGRAGIMGHLATLGLGAEDLPFDPALLDGTSLSFAELRIA